jgi:AraC-like DNA-binding protein
MPGKSHPTKLTIPSDTHEYFLRSIAAIGVDAAAVAERYGRTKVKPPNERITLDEMYELWEAALDVTGESGLGVRLGQYLRPSNYGLYGQLMSSSSTLGEALVLSARLHGLVAISVRMSLHIEGGRARNTLEPVSARVHPETIDIGMAAQVAIIRHLVGRDFPLIEVTFSREAPRSQVEYQRVFRAPLRFGRAENAIWFDSAMLELPVTSANPGLKASLMEKAERRAETLRRPAQLQQQVSDAIAVELGTGSVSCERVASRLGMHPKALGRQLKDLNTSYREMLEHVRREFAERYLKSGGLSVERVALLLGYSEKSAFNRAFKRWSGQSPVDYRKSL